MKKIPDIEGYSINYLSNILQKLQYYKKGRLRHCSRLKETKKK